MAEGRVFLGRHRALSTDEPVKEGDEVHIARKVEALHPATLLYDEGGLVAADKPADVVTVPDHEGAAGSLLAAVARTLGVHPLTLHATSRLDRGVSGVVVFARTAEAAERLRMAREAGTYLRRYLALAVRAPSTESGEWDAAIGRAPDPRHRAIAGRDAVPAVTRYTVIARAGEWALLALEPITGRTHQLRVHAAHAHAPLLGDRVYGGPARTTLPTGGVLSFDRIALHAARVSIPGKGGGLVEIAAPVPSRLAGWWKAMGGDAGAWDAALAVSMGSRA